MTGDPRERFTDEEWALLTDTPMVAGMLVATAGRLGNIRAVLAVIGEYAATRERLPGPLLAAILDSPRPDVRARVGRRKTLPQKGPPVLRAGMELLARKASDDEREEVTRFVLAVADAAARVGGDQRQAALRNVAAILSSGGQPSGGRLQRHALHSASVVPTNLAVLMREAFVALNDLVLARLADRGHGDVRAAHGAVFRQLDETGTTVSTLAERAQITEEAMAELVLYLEARGYGIREPDPDDRRAKLVLPTARGREVVAIAQDLVPQLEDRISAVLGADRVQALREDLETIREIATS